MLRSALSSSRRARRPPPDTRGRTLHVRGSDRSPNGHHTAPAVGSRAGASAALTRMEGTPARPAGHEPRPSRGTMPSVPERCTRASTAPWRRLDPFYVRHRTNVLPRAQRTHPAEAELANWPSPDRGLVDWRACARVSYQYSGSVRRPTSVGVFVRIDPFLPVDWSGQRSRTATRTSLSPSGRESRMNNANGMARRVSAVLPCHNGERYLRDAIESVRRQTRPVDEVIVVDDGSKDGSAALAEQLGATVVRLSPNRGPSAARNAGIRAASGDTVAFLDADDVWLPRHCERLVSLLEAHSSTVLAFGGFRVLGGGATLSRDDDPSGGAPFSALVPLLRRNFVLQSAAVVDRGAVMKVGAYDESIRYAEDCDLWLRLAQTGPFVGSREVTTERRLHEAQATNSLLKMRASAWEVRARAMMRAQDVQAAQASSAPLAAMGAALLDAWSLELEEAWNSGRTDLLDLTLSLHEQVPGSEALLRSWQRRRRFIWPARTLARAAWRRSRNRPLYDVG